MIARIPCGDGNFVPVLIIFDQKRDWGEEQAEIIINEWRMPQSFFHLSASTSGNVCRCRNLKVEKTLSETMRSAKEFIVGTGYSCPCQIAALHMYYASLDKYKEYKQMCMNLFRGYHLTQPECWPDLTIVKVAAKAGLKRLREEANT